MYYVVLSVGVVISLIFCFNRSKGYSVNNLIFKSVSSLCYLLTAVFALITNYKAYTYGSLVIMGGALGLVGDILLDLKGIYKNEEKIYLKGGHIFYFCAVIYSIKMKWYLVLIAAVVSVIIGVLTVASANLMKVHYGAYRRIVAVYVAFLAMTSVISIIAVFVTHFQKAYVIMAIGSVLFLLSDAVLSNTFFGRGKDKPIHLFINHFLYYAGQYLIAASVMFA